MKDSLKESMYNPQNVGNSQFKKYSVEFYNERMRAGQNKVMKEVADTAPQQGGDEKWQTD